MDTNFIIKKEYFSKLLFIFREFKYLYTYVNLLNLKNFYKIIKNPLECFYNIFKKLCLAFLNIGIIF